MAVYIKSPDEYVFGPARPEFEWLNGESEYEWFLTCRELHQRINYTSGDFLFVDEKEDVPTVDAPMDSDRPNRQRSYPTMRALWKGCDKD